MLKIHGYVKDLASKMVIAEKTDTKPSTVMHMSRWEAKEELPIKSDSVVYSVTPA